MASNNVTIEVDLITRQAQANAEALSGSLIGINSAVDLAVKALSAVGAVLSVVADAFVDSTKNAIAFEYGLAGIKTIAQDANLDTLRKELLDISAAWGFDELSAATAQYDLISSGFTDTADAAKVLSASAALATAGMGDLGGTAKVVAVAINAFSLSATDADRVTDVLTKTTQFGVTTLNELGPAFGQVASIAAGASVSLEETSAAMATITLTGKTASESATGLKSLLSSLLKPSDDLSKAFKSVSDKSIAASIAQDGLGKTLELIRGAIGSGSDRWIKYLGSVDAASSGITLASGKQKEFTDITAAMNDKTKAAGEATREMAAIVKASASNSIDVMNQSFKNLGIEIFSVFEPAIASAAKVVTDFIVDVKAFVRENEVALKAVGRAAVDMVRDFGEFVKAVVASQELRNALVSLKDVGISAFEAFTSAFKKVGFEVKGAEGILGKFSTVLNELKPIIDAVATALGTWVSWVIQISTILPRLASEYLPKLAEGFTSLQKTLFGFTGAYADGTKAVQSYADVTKLGAAAFGAQKAAIDPLLVSFEKVTKATEKSLGAMTLREAALKRSIASESAFVDSTKKLTEEQKKAASEAKKAVEEQAKVDDDNLRNTQGNLESKLENYRKYYDSFSTDTSQHIKDYAEAFKKEDDLEKQRIKESNDNAESNLENREANFRANFSSFASGVIEAEFDLGEELKALDAQIANSRLATLKDFYSGLEGIVSAFSGIASSYAKEETATIEAQIEAAKKIRIDAANTVRDAEIKASEEAWESRINRAQELGQEILDAAVAVEESIFEKQKELIEEGAAIKKEAIVVEFDAKKQAILDLADLEKTDREKALEDALYPIKIRLEEEKIRLKEIQREELKNAAELSVAQVTEIKVRQKRELDAIDARFKPEMDSIKKKAKEEERSAKKVTDAKIKEIDRSEKAEIEAVKKAAEIDIAGKKKATDEAISGIKKKEDEALKQTIERLTKEASKEKTQIEENAKVRESKLSDVENNLAKLRDANTQPLLDKASATAGALSAIFEKIPGAVGQVGSLIAGLAAVIFKLPEILEQIPAMVNDLLAAIPAVITGIIEKLPMVIQGLVMALPNFFRAIIENLPSLVSALLELLVNPEFWWKLAVSFGDAMIKLLDPTFLYGIAEKVVFALGDAFAEAGEFFADIALAVWDALKVAFEAVGDWLADVGMKIWGGLKKGIEDAGDFFANIGKTIGNAFKDAAKSVVDTLSDLLKPKGTPLSQKQKDEWNLELPGLGTSGTISSIGYAAGGLIPGGRGSNDSILNDVVPALLSPGELVIPRSAIAGGMGDVMAFAAEALGTRGPRRMNFASGGMVGATTSSFSRGNNSDVVDRLVSLEAKFDQLGYAIARNTMKTAQVLEQWNYDGLPETRAV
jgi:TP901 family phage tail tape measure protein